VFPVAGATGLYIRGADRWPGLAKGRAAQSQYELLCDESRRAA